MSVPRAVGVLAVALVLGATPLVAQDAGENRTPPSAWRRWVYAGLGAILGTIPAFIGSNEAGAPEWCGSQRCDAFVSGGLSAGIGFLIGREHDRAALQRWRVGRSLSFEQEQRALPLSPQRLLPASGGGALLVATSGVQLVRPDLELVPHGGELRGVTAAVDLPRLQSLLVGTDRGLFAFPLLAGNADGGADRGRGVRLSPAAVTGLLRVDSAEVIVAGADSLTRVEVTGAGAGWDARDVARAALGDTLLALAYAEQSGVLWTVEGAALRARDRSTLDVITELELPVRARSFAVDGVIGAVSADAGEALLLDLSRPRQPEIAATVRMDAVYLEAGTALHGGRLYLAAGQQGLVVVDVPRAGDWELVGVVRGIGSVDGVAAGDDGVYVLDRRTSHIRKVRLLE